MGKRNNKYGTNAFTYMFHDKLTMQYLMVLDLRVIYMQNPRMALQPATSLPHHKVGNSQSASSLTSSLFSWRNRWEKGNNNYEKNAFTDIFHDYRMCTTPNASSLVPGSTVGMVYNWSTQQSWQIFRCDFFSNCQVPVKNKRSNVAQGIGAISSLIARYRSISSQFKKNKNKKHRAHAKFREKTTRNTSQSCSQAEHDMNSSVFYTCWSCSWQLSSIFQTLCNILQLL